jgi:hypothetical protein
MTRAWPADPARVAAAAVEHMAPGGNDPRPQDTPGHGRPATRMRRRPGFFTWTTPADRIYTIGPDVYPTWAPRSDPID